MRAGASASRISGATLVALATMVALTVVVSGAIPSAAGPASTLRSAGLPVARHDPSAAVSRSPLAPTPAAATANWFNLTPSLPLLVPGLETFAALAYDPALNGTLMFGGYNSSLGGPNGETWLFANGTWTDLTPGLSISPGARWGPLMTWDPWNDEMILFGGRTSGNTLNDTWSFSSTGWSNITATVAPSPRQTQFSVFAADPTLKAVYLYGGYCFLCGGTFYNDSWTFVNGTWTDVTSSVTGAPSTFDFGGWDGATGDIVGYVSTATDCTGTSSTYSFNGSAWALLGSNSTPGPVQSGGGFVYDGLARAMILYGGGLQIAGQCKGYAGTWSYSNNTWTNLTTNLTNSPPARCCESIAYDATQRVVLLLGGTTNTNFYVGDTWTFPAVPLSVGINASTTVGRPPLAVNFTANVSGGAGPVTLNWSFGDGTANGSGASVLHNFSTAGKYEVNFTALDSQGRSVNRSVEILVAPRLVAGASASPYSGEAPVQVNFSAVAVGGLGPFQYNWTFGDLSSGTGANISHVYQAGGTFAATVTIHDGSRQVSRATVNITVAPAITVTIVTTPNNAAGDAPLLVDFSAEPTGNATPWTAVWHFGDGTPPDSSGLNVSHHYLTAGRYTALVTVTDAMGHQANGTVPVAVASPLEAVATASHTVGLAPLTVTFTGVASNGTSPYVFRWSFGDGTVNVTGAGPSHLYPTVGTYTVQLTATDGGGGRNVSTIEIVVVKPMTVAAVENVTSGIYPLSVEFNATVTGGLLPETYSWLFGDGTSATVANVTHLYTSASTFSISLTVSDSLGEIAHRSFSVQVFAPLRVTATANPASIMVGAITNLTAAATGGSGGTVYTWGSLPPGCAASNVAVLACSPTSTGTFNITVGIRDSRNDPASAFVQLTVTPVPPTGVTTSPSGSGGLTKLDLLGVAAVAAVLGAAAVILVFRRRGRPPTEETPEPEVVEPPPPEAEDAYGMPP